MQYICYGSVRNHIEKGEAIMLRIPPCKNTVRGFEIELTHVSNNLAEPGCGNQYLHDEYLQLCVTSDGSYDAAIGRGFWDFRIVQLRIPTLPEFECPAGFAILPLRPDDVLHRVQLRECTVAGIGYGVWLFTKFTNPAEDASLAHSLRLYAPPMHS